MTTDAEALADRIEAPLAAQGTPERAAGERQYLKSDLQFHGVSVWAIRRAVAEVLRAEALDRDGAIALVEALWSRPVFERRMAAIFVLDAAEGSLTADDLPLIERLIRESRTWALVDGLAGDVVGRVLASDPRTVSTLDRWARDADFWVRRSALLAWLRPLRAGASLDDFLRYADAMLEEREFFIRKAIGWVLREVGKRRPEAVAAWLGPRTHRASGVTMREAVKYLPANEAAALMDAYRAHRPLTS